MKLDVYQVAEATKIRTDHIRALEAGEYDVFVAPVYIRGFVRTYATLLKLEVPKVMADLAEELGRTKNFSEPPALTDQPKSWIDAVMLFLSRIDWRVLVGVLGAALVILAAVVGYRLYHTQKTTDPLKNLGSGLYQPKGSNAADTLPLPGSTGR